MSTQAIIPILWGLLYAGVIYLVIVCAPKWVRYHQIKARSSYARLMERWRVADARRVAEWEAFATPCITCGAKGRSLCDEHYMCTECHERFLERFGIPLG